MTIDRYIRLAAGFLTVLSIILSQFYSPYWLYFTVFIGLNLLQSAFTNWCPLMTILKKVGVKEQ